MKQFKEYERLAYSFINDNDYYIIFNDGKPIRSNLEEDMVEISLDSNIDSFDICRRRRPNEEEDIVSNAHFNNCINIKKDIDLKIIYLNDDEDFLSFSFDIERNVKVNMIHIFLACQRDCRILRDYNLNDNVLLNNITFNNYENKVVVEDKPLELNLKVEKGKKDILTVSPEKPISILTKKGETRNVEVNFAPVSPIVAPVQKGDIVGKISVYEQGILISSVNVVSDEDVEKAAFSDYIKSIIIKWGVTD